MWQARDVVILLVSVALLTCGALRPGPGIGWCADPVVGPPAGDERVIGHEFDRLYGAWRAKTAIPDPRSDAEWAWALPEYRGIVELGPAVLPLIFREIEKGPDALCLGRAISEITRVQPIW